MESDLMQTEVNGIKKFKNISEKLDSKGDEFLRRDKIPFEENKVGYDLEFLGWKKTRSSHQLKYRKDVVNKIIIRTIKKLFSLKFKSEHPQPRFRSKSKQLRFFYESLRKFNANIISNKYETNVNSGMDESVAVIGLMINANIFKK
jgi:hypothetical protein